jgi:hypothetical protein
MNQDKFDIWDNQDITKYDFAYQNDKKQIKHLMPFRANQVAFKLFL